MEADKFKVLSLYNAAKREEVYQQKIISKQVIPTNLGYKFLNNALLGGANKEDILLIAGLSGSGKSTLAIDIGYNIVTLNQNVRVLVFSFEVPGRKIAAKLISKDIKKTLQEMYLSDQTVLIKDKYEHFRNLPFDIIEIPLKVSIMRDSIKQYCQKYPNDRVHVIIDHTLLAIGRDGEDENEVLKSIARMCNEDKTELNIVYILVSQLNNAMLDPRRLSYPGGQYPNLTDIFGSKYLCHVANNIICIIDPTKLNLPNKHYGPNELPLTLNLVKKTTGEKETRNYFYACTIKARDGELSVEPLINNLRHSKLIELGVKTRKAFFEKHKI